MAWPPLRAHNIAANVGDLPRRSRIAIHLGVWGSLRAQPHGRELVSGW